MRTIRGWLLVSHSLPVLITIPLVGIALIYMIETQVVLPNLAQELAEQAALVRELAEGRDEIWRDSSVAQAFVSDIGAHATSRVMLVSGDGRLLASNDPRDAQRIGAPLDVAGLRDVLAGGSISRTAYSRYLHSDIADVLAPVYDSRGHTIGVIRLSRQLAEVYQRFANLRYVIVGILLPGLALGVLAGGVIGLSLERPVHDMTAAIGALASGRRTMRLPETGPRDVREMVGSLNTLVERLRTLEETRRVLLANLVHELGRPLGALNSAIAALSSGAADDPALRHDLLAGMLTEVLGLRRLLDDLARLHDQVVGALTLQRRVVALNDWLPGLLAPWREAARRKGLEWRATLPPALPPVMVDSDRLAQALGNLFSNAIKYTSTGMVSVDVGADSGDVWICVADTGPGITAEASKHIFEPFYRGDRGTRFPQGMGLGLSIAHDLISAHGGRLSVESEPGSGSRFTVRLPHYQPEMSAGGSLAN